jgi:hypothetical protein
MANSLAKCVERDGSVSATMRLDPHPSKTKGAAPDGFQICCSIAKK